MAFIFTAGSLKKNENANIILNVKVLKEGLKNMAQAHPLKFKINQLHVLTF